MRNSQYHWILIPCELSESTRVINKSGRKITALYVRYEKNKFILCDMSHPPKEVRRLTGYTLVEKGVLKKKPTIIEESTNSSA